MDFVSDSDEPDESEFRRVPEPGEAADLLHDPPDEEPMAEFTSELEALVSCEGSADVASGELASSAFHLLEGPGLEVAGLGLLPLPVDVNIFTALQRLSGAAPSTEILIEPSGICFKNPSWQHGRVPAAFLDALSRDFAVPSGAHCTATLRGLSVAGPGGDFAVSVSVKEPGLFGILIVILPSRWSDGVLTVHHGPVSHEFQHKSTHSFGGSLQHVAFFADCELRATKVSSGYRAALVYGLSLRSASAAAMPFRAPTWPSDVVRLQTLLRSWNARLSSSDVEQGTRLLPQRALIVLESDRPSIDALKGFEKSLCALVRYALEGCPEVGGYLARLSATEQCVAESLRDHDHDRCRMWDRYHGEDEDEASEDHDVDEYDWEVDSVAWALKDWVDLRSGLALDAFSKEVFVGSKGGHRRRDALIPADACEDMLGGDPRKFTLDEDDGVSAHATRKYSRVVLVLSIRRDAWHELAAGAGIDAALALLLTELGLLNASRGGAAAGIQSPNLLLAHLHDKRARLTASPSGSVDEDALPDVSQSSHALLREALVARGPLAIATSLFDSYLRRRSTLLAAAGTRLPIALLEVILASPRSPSPALLLSRVLNDFGCLLVERDPRLLAAVLSSVVGDMAPVEALCRALRSASVRLSSPLFAGALHLARSLLGYPDRASLPSAAPGAGEKRRRGNDGIGSAPVVQLMDNTTRDRLARCGRAVLSAIACSFADTDDPLTVMTLRELVALTLKHGSPDEVASFVHAKLYVIARDLPSLSALLDPRDEPSLDALERGIAAGLPQLASRSLGPAMLLAFAWLLCNLKTARAPYQTLPDAAVFPAPAVGQNDASPGPSAGALLKARCADVMRALPSEPLEPSTLTLVETPASFSELGLRVNAAPVQVTNEFVERLLRAVVCAWPRPSNAGQSGSSHQLPPAIALLKLLIRRPASGLASEFVARRLDLIVQSASASSALIGALIPAVHSTEPPAGLWDGVAQGVAAVFDPDRLAQSRSQLPYLPRVGGTDASSTLPLAAFVHALAVRLRGAAKTSEPGVAEPHASASSPRMQLARVLRTLVERWPSQPHDSSSSAVALQVMRALALEGSIATAVAFLPRLSSNVLFDSLRQGVMALAIENLGWTTFGLSFGRAVAAALQPATALSAALDIVAAARVGYEFVRTASTISGARVGESGAFTSAARTAIQPVIRAVADVAVGIRRVRLAPLSDAGVSVVAGFVFDSRVAKVLSDDSGRAAYPAGLPTTWLQFAASEAGRAAYSVAALIGFVQKELSGSSSLKIPRPNLILLLDALISAESARLAPSLPPLTWARNALCSSCTANPTGPSSCPSINSFMADSAQRSATFVFTNMQKLKHVLSLCRRPHYYSQPVNVEQADRQLRITKLPNTSAAAQHAAAVEEQTKDRARLRQLEGLRQSCLAAPAAAPGGAAARAAVKPSPGGLAGPGGAVAGPRATSSAPGLSAEAAAPAAPATNPLPSAAAPTLNPAPAAPAPNPAPAAPAPSPAPAGGPAAPAPSPHSPKAPVVIEISDSDEGA